MDTELSILPPTDDWVFKLLFGDERHKGNTIAFLKSFMNLPKEDIDITFLNPALKPEAEEDKMGIIDIKLAFGGERVIDVEIQMNPFPELGKRISFYKSKLVVEQIGKGEDYSVIKRVICVGILDYRYFRETKEYLNWFKYYNPKNGLCFEGIPEELYTIELPKVPEESDGEAVWEWMRFLKARRKEDFEMLAEKNPDIREAVNTLYRISEDPEVRAQMEYREKARLDRATLLSAAAREGKREVAASLKAMGIPVGQIAQATGLSDYDIAGL
jgi:predicted transposase/invertase (TIGR01784 family)